MKRFCVVGMFSMMNSVLMVEVIMIYYRGIFDIVYGSEVFGGEVGVLMLGRLIVENVSMIVVLFS